MPLLANDTQGAITRKRLETYVAQREKVTAVALTDAASTPTAALVIAALTDEATGTSFEFTIVNLASAFEIVVTTNTGWTITGGGRMTVFDGCSATFLAVVTSTTTCQLYRMGSGGAVA